MNPEPSMPKWLFYFATLIASLTWFLIIVGGIVHGTGSSLACPDWPTCYGTFFPEMKGGVFFEHSHRIVAASVGFLSVLLCLFLLWKGNKKLRLLGILAVFLVIFQGILGGITVIYRLPTAISTAHLGTSMLFFALLIWISDQLYLEAFPKKPSGTNFTTTPRAWILSTMILVYLQILLGALVRHTGAGLACMDIPLCRGSLWPANSAPILKAHMVHRIFAMVVAIAVFMTSFKVAMKIKGQAFIRFLTITAPLLVLFQISLGLLSIYSALALIPVTAHLAVAALLWANMVLLNLKTRELAPHSASHEAHHPLQDPVTA
jgi:heme A synthase